MTLAAFGFGCLVGVVVYVCTSPKVSASICLAAAFALLLALGTAF